MKTKMYSFSDKIKIHQVVEALDLNNGGNYSECLIWLMVVGSSVKGWWKKIGGMNMFTPFYSSIVCLLRHIDIVKVLRNDIICKCDLTTAIERTYTLTQKDIKAASKSLCAWLNRKTEL